MSRNYLVGEQTKLQIFTESKKLFYKKGFDETTYDDICNVAKINRALIPYYFKNKQNLGSMVYRDIYSNFKETLYALLESEHFPSDLATAIETFAYYRLLKSPEFARFALQVMNNNAVIDARMIKGEQRFISEISSDKKFSIKELEILANFDYSIEKEIHRMVAVGGSDVDTDSLCGTELNMILGYAGHSKKKINELINNSLDYLSHVQFTVKSGFAIQISRI